MTKNLTFIPIPNIPLVSPGDDIAQLIVAALATNGQSLLTGDIIVVAQKIVSKAEDRFVDLKTVTPSTRALELAALTKKDPRQVEVILWDTTEIIRAKPGVLIVQHRAGSISANAGLDHSNVAPETEEFVLRLPADADESARRIRHRLADLTGERPPVLVIDSHGRPWRIGTTGVVIGVAGLKPVQDLRGHPDLFGNRLQHTEVAFADQLAAGASLVMGQTTAACPVASARGLAYAGADPARAGAVLLADGHDTFRYKLVYACYQLV